jgi:hypothetical protein
MPTTKTTVARKPPSKSGAATGQPADNYPNLGDEKAAGEAQASTGASAPGDQADQAGKPELDLKAPYNMVWYNGLKQYYQDKRIFDRGSKQYLCDA